MNQKNKLTVDELFEEKRNSLSFTLLNNSKGLKKIIKEHDLYRPGLLLSGYTEAFSNTKIQVLGNTDQLYLKQLSDTERTNAFQRLMDADIPCLIITSNGSVDKKLIEIADKAETCVFKSALPTIQIYQELFDFLNEKAAPWTTTHGTLVSVYGIGVLFTGKSGIGKSEIALDLVERGHRLVADDVVRIFRKSAGVLVGTSEGIIKNMLEIRGVGLIDVWSMFGIRAIRVQKRVEVEVHLEHAKDLTKYDRLGADQKFQNYLGVEIPLIHLPILPGKNITVIAETIALKAMQRVYGIEPEHDFMRRLDEKIKENTNIRNYLTGDLE